MVAFLLDNKYLKFRFRKAYNKTSNSDSKHLFQSINVFDTFELCDCFSPHCLKNQKTHLMLLCSNQAVEIVL